MKTRSGVEGEASWLGCLGLSGACGAGEALPVSAPPNSPRLPVGQTQPAGGWAVPRATTLQPCSSGNASFVCRGTLRRGEKPRLAAQHKESGPAAAAFKISPVTREESRHVQQSNPPVPSPRESLPHALKRIRIITTGPLRF